MFLYFNRLPEDGTQVPKRVGDDTYNELYFVICILLSTFVGSYIEYKKMLDVSNIKLTGQVSKKYR